MDPWTLGLVAVIVIGVTLILYGALFDRRRNRRAREEMLSPPKRDIPQFRPDAPAPQYLSELQARRAPADAPRTALSDRDRDSITAQLRNSNTITVAAGFASPAFVTDAKAGWAVLEAPTVLVCAAGLDTMREVLPLLEGAAMSGRALVVTAPAITKDVLATLEVNVIQQKIRLLALTADKHTLATIAAHTGARPLDRGDLQAGYIPAHHLGHCGRWVSDKRRSWLLPTLTSPSDQTPTQASPE